MPVRPTHLLKTAVALAFGIAAAQASAQYSTPMRDVENPDRTPFLLQASGSLDTPYVNGFVQFTLNNGKRYFLEYVSLICTTPSAADSFTTPYLVVTQNVGSNSTVGYSLVPFYMVRLGAAPFGGYNWAGSAMVKLFSDSGSFGAPTGNGVQFNVFHTDNSVRATCTGLISGHTLP
ncbi:hypothetical protein [Derxia lacustris]|uniref:hypothetical protein n=1 Tax=Derxia lacustris TaxID=764842 RepID=UPI000A16E584|nr:hypothetical protein [Derxia lacustris]